LAGSADRPATCGLRAAGRSRQSWTHPDEFMPDSQLPPEQLIQRNEQLQRLNAALAQLPEDQRTVLELKFLQGCTVAEICERTRRPGLSVAGLLFKGSKALLSLLSDAKRPGDTGQP
jgi:RNA polymerase sigma-70 factor (ECF subfamily)